MHYLPLPLYLPLIAQIAPAAAHVIPQDTFNQSGEPVPVTPRASSSSIPLPGQSQNPSVSTTAVPPNSATPPLMSVSQFRQRGVSHQVSALITSEPPLNFAADVPPNTPSPTLGKQQAPALTLQSPPVPSLDLKPKQFSPQPATIIPQTPVVLPRPVVSQSLQTQSLQTQARSTPVRAVVKVASRKTVIPQKQPQKLLFIAQAQPSVPSPPGTSPGKPSTPVIELKADRQDYDQERQILTAEGNVVMRYQGAILDADRVQISFLKRQAVADGNASLVQGEGKKLFGNRLEYNYGNGSGKVFQARSEVYLKNIGPKDNPTLPSDVGRTGVSEPLLSQRLILQQPLQNVTQAGQFSIVGAFGGTSAGLQEGQVNVPKSGGSVNRYRIEAEQIIFDDRGWEATNVRLTNDPFSPPELEIRAKTARVRAIGPYEDELLLQNGRIVFDQKTAIPLVLQRYVINRRRNNPIPSLVEFGYDAQERGGFFIQRTQTLFSNSKVQWTISPQFYIQAALSPNAFRQKLGVGNQTAANGPFDPNLYGFRTDIKAELTPDTLFSGFLSLTSLTQLQDNLRARLSLRQNITPERPNYVCINRPATQTADTSNETTAETAAASAPPKCGIYEIAGNYNIRGEFTYRDRFFNGSLGFQTVQQSFGAVLTSPTYQIARTGINLSYQLSGQEINAITDRAALISSDNSRVTLGRLQASVALSRGFTFWQGKPLPATASEGLKYTASPVVPYFGAFAGLNGVGTYYTSGDTQNYLQATIGIQGQRGNFSKPFGDYTGFNLSLVQTFLQGQSPYLFDRLVDQRFFSAGISQQLYGPLRVGAQTAINLDTGREISTDYTVEYSRRTYSVILRYNPVQQIGSVNLIINDFNWVGGTNPFSNAEIRSVEGGIIRSQE